MAKKKLRAEEVRSGEVFSRDDLVAMYSLRVLEWGYDIIGDQFGVDARAAYALSQQGAQNLPPDFSKRLMDIVRPYKLPPSRPIPEGLKRRSKRIAFGLGRMK
jgi:hypothetical protein